jgi:hypothetical protein
VACHQVTETYTHTEWRCDECGTRWDREGSLDHKGHLHTVAWRDHDFCSDKCHTVYALKRLEATEDELRAVRAARYPAHCSGS